jgi:hypothetical protein
MVAAIRAVWAAAGFEPDNSLAERLAGCGPHQSLADVELQLGASMFGRRMP